MPGNQRPLRTIAFFAALRFIAEEKVAGGGNKMSEAPPVTACFTGVPAQ
jgi:hypothetical protein